MNFRVILTFTTLSLLLLMGCAQRTYIMDFDKSSSAYSKTSFAQPAVLQEESGIPQSVTRPNDPDVYHRAEATPSSRGDRAEAANRGDRAVATPSSNALYVGSPVAATAAASNFTTLEQEHVKFTSYNPFDEVSASSFDINLDAIASEFTYPITGRFSSAYGRRGRGIHTGIDIVAPVRTPIYAAFSGVVRLSKPYSGYGNAIVIRHNNGMETVYTHNSKNLVRVGQYVGSGEKIALCGRTGNATTDHLHFEVRINGQAINPELIVDVNKQSIQRGVIIVSQSAQGNVTAKRRTDNTPSVALNRNEVKSSPSVPAKAKTSTKTSTKTTVKTSANTQSAVTQGTKAAASASSSKGMRIDGKLYSAPAAGEGQSAPQWYTVVRGDTLSEIADKHSISIAALCELNGISRNSVIRVGRKLRVR